MRLSKSYKAESGISRIKKYCSRSMKVRKDNNWIIPLNNYLRIYNKNSMKGTKRSKKSINKRNYEQAVLELFKTKDYSAIVQLSSWKDIPDEIASKIFKFKVGQRVFLELSSDPKVSFAFLIYIEKLNAILLLYTHTLLFSR
jgi:hypothetical protein